MISSACVQHRTAPDSHANHGCGGGGPIRLNYLADKDRDETGAPSLPPGKYLVKAYVDRKKHLTTDPTLMLGADEFCGQVEIEAQWGVGFPEAQRITGAELK